MNTWHNQLISEAASLFTTDVEQGLADQEVAARLARYGPNKLREGKRFSALAYFTNQYKRLVNWVLIGAAGKFPPYERSSSS